MTPLRERRISNCNESFVKFIESTLIIASSLSDEESLYGRTRDLVHRMI